MTDPSEHSGSRWEPSEPVEPVEPIERVERVEPVEREQPDQLVPYDPPTAAWDIPVAPSKRRPRRLALGAGAIALLAAGGAGGFVAGHVTAGNGDGSSVVDRNGGTQQDQGFPGDDGGDRGTPPDQDGDGGGVPSFPDQGQPGSGTDSGSSSTSGGSAT